MILQAGASLLLAGLAFLVGLFVLWIIVSVPVYIAAKILTIGKARFTRAMLVTAVGPIVIAIVFVISELVLSVTLGKSMFVVTAVSFILAFIAWVGVFKRGFDTGWLRALSIAVLASIVFFVIGILITLAIRQFVPTAPALTPFPYPLQQA